MMSDQQQLEVASCTADSSPDSSLITHHSSLLFTQHSLRPLVSETLAHLSRSTHPWARTLARVLRTRIVAIAPLPFRMSGLTTPIIPVILLDRRFVAQNLAAGPVGRARVMQTLLHEAAHQLWAVWPEWRNWLGDAGHYGPERNAADAIAEGIMRSCGQASCYAGREISYVSPLSKLASLWRAQRVDRPQR